MERLGDIVNRLMRRIAVKRPAEETPVCRACGTTMVQATPAIYVCPRCREARREKAKEKTDA